MVVPLGPGKFYGSSLPRPRIYTDVKLNSERVDPPVSVSDPMMSWAREAHWSMGGLSFKRFRLQGRIEGNVNRLRSQREKFFKKRDENSATANQIGDSNIDSEDDNEKNFSPSPPPAPVATKRRRFTALTDEEDDSSEEIDLKRSGGDEVRGRKKLARKLGNDFDRVAAAEDGLGKSRESPVRNRSGGLETVATRTRSRKIEESDGGANAIKPNFKVKKLRRLGEIEEEKAKKVAERGSSKPLGGVRTSPRLAMR